MRKITLLSQSEDFINTTCEDILQHKWDDAVIVKPSKSASKWLEKYFVQNKEKITVETNNGKYTLSEVEW